MDVVLYRWGIGDEGVLLGVGVLGLAPYSSIKCYTNFIIIDNIKIWNF